MSAVLGAFLFCGSAAMVWFIRPREGREHKLLENYALQNLIIIAIVSGLAIGFTLLLSGLFS